jgi:hypothetical protein
MDGLFQKAFEGLVIFRLFKDRYLGIRPIQNVIHQTAIGCSFWSSHAHNLPKPRHLAKNGS